MNLDTILVHGSEAHKSSTGSISMPIYQTATFEHPELGKSTGYDYTRTLNPTREKLEKSYALLESAYSAFAFSSGMSAISAVFELFNSGDEIIVCDDLYGGSFRLFEQISQNRNLKFHYIDTSNLELIQNTYSHKTKAIFIETPTNPMMKVTDIQKLSEFSRSKKIYLIADNTFLTPYFQRPIELGADISLCSATKYIGGHNDTLAGLVAVNSIELDEKIRFIQNTVGSVLAPFDSWLILRGLKTLGLRMSKSEKNAIQIVDFLKKNSSVLKVYYPGSADHKSFELSKKQTTGFGAMISFEVSSKSIVEKILKRVKIISFAESLGGVESLITYPLVQTHSAIPEQILTKLGINDRLLRLSVGIEDSQDLIQDLEQALNEN
jgi:cystathionine gamma-synthase